MTKQKDFKRLVRARMRKSGESYTAARARLLAKRSRAARPTSGTPPTAGTPPGPVPERAYASRAGMRDDAVAAKTGRTWAQWVDVLDAAGAGAWLHRDIAKHLHAMPGMTHWWAQTVAVGYERIRGLRDVGQSRPGAAAAAYAASKSRTFPVSRAALFRACRDARARAEWMPGSGVTLRKATAPKSLRLRGPGGEPVEMVFLAKAAAKAAVQIQVGGLPSRAAVDAEKERWHRRLDALGAWLARD